jgi:hypothetical protein
MCPHASTRLTRPAKYATAAGGGYSENVPATRKEHRSRRLALARQAFFLRKKFKLGKLEKQKTLKRILFFSRMLVHERGPSRKIIAPPRLPMLQTSNQVPADWSPDVHPASCQTRNCHHTNGQDACRSYPSRTVLGCTCSARLWLAAAQRCAPESRYSPNEDVFWTL